MEIMVEYVVTIKCGSSRKDLAKKNIIPGGTKNNFNFYKSYAEFHHSLKEYQKFIKNNFDYVNNFFERTFPIGTEIEIFSFEVLEQCWKFAKKSSEKELPY